MTRTNAAAASFAAVEAIASGEWDRFLLSIHLAVRQRMQDLGTSAQEEAMTQFIESEMVKKMPEQLDAFRDEMREKGIHVGVQGTCATCGTPWPCGHKDEPEAL